MIEQLKQIYLDLSFRFFPIWRLNKSGASVGENVFVGKNVYIELENAPLLTIEDDAVLSAFTKIILHDSSLCNTLGHDCLYGKVIIKENCYIGANCVILPGTEVGANTIVGANSLVKGKLKSNSVYMGSPAKYYCSISQLEKRWKNKKNKLIYFKKEKRFYEK